MQLPAPLDRLDLGEILGFLRTAGQCPLVGPDGEQLVSLWFVVGRDRCWLVAGTREAAWQTASTDVALDRGWTQDAVKVGAWSAPLRAGSRAQAEGLLTQWRLAEKGGDERPAEVPVHPPERAQAARGAEIPAWIAEHVPADPDERWLIAVDTKLAKGFPGRDGHPTSEDLWFAATDRRAVFVAKGPWIHVEPTSTARWPKTAEWLRAEPEDVWELAVRRALDERAWDRAIALVAEAYVLERHEGLWGWIGLLALGSGAPEAAVGALLRQLARDPDPGSLALGANDGSTRIKRLERASPRLPVGPLSECVLPTLPDGLPWPPDGPTEVHALAGVLAGPATTPAGLALHGTLGDPARTARVRAAIAAWRHDPDAGQAWWDAAMAGWPADPDLARKDAARAIALTPEGPGRARLRWLASTWAVARNADPTPLWSAALPHPPPADLPLPAGVWRRLAELATVQQAPEAASVAWRAVGQALPDDRVALQHEARLLESLGRPEDALAALTTLAERTERAIEPSPARWEVLAEVARVARSLNRTEQAARALSQAVADDFLHVEALDRAIALGHGVVPDERLAWWTHLRGVLTGSASPGRAPAPSLSAAELDALHPGGVGWLDRVRRSIDPRDPPPIKDLTRGLERIEASRWPQVTEPLAELAPALGIPVPAAYLFRGEGAWGLSAWPTVPPVLLVGHDHLDPTHPLALHPDALRFALAVELTHLAAGHPLLGWDTGLVGTSRSVYAAFGRYAGTAETVIDLVTLVPGIDQLAKLQTLVKISKRVFSARSVVDKASGVAGSGMAWLGWAGPPGEASDPVHTRFAGPAIQFRLHADRAALALTGDLGRAVEAVLRGSPISAPHAQQAREHGLIAVLDALDPDTRLRVAGLVGYAASL